MKKLVFLSLFSLFAIFSSGQPCFDLGIKGGFTSSELSSVKSWDYISDNIINYHAGAFSRIGWGRLFLQPEAYFNTRGGNLKEIAGGSVEDAASKFDFSSVDVPLLAGIKIIKRDLFNLRIMGGPMFGFVTSKSVEGDPEFTTDYFNNHFYGWQYGAGIDLWFITLDLRVENSRNSVYQSSDFSSRNKVFLVTAGIKIF